jgi:hypothetical protein
MSNFKNYATQQQKRNSLWYAEFNDGYSLRNLIEYLKSTNISGVLHFCPDKIKYCRADVDQTILNEVVIYASDLPEYIYRAKEPSIAVGVTISNLRKITKSIGKKDGLCLYMNQGDPRLHILPISANSKSSTGNNVNSILPQQIKDQEYEVTGYLNSEDKPNCTIPISDFCRMCTGMWTISCSYVTIKVYPKGVCFEGLTEGGVITTQSKFGTTTMTNTTKECISTLLSNVEIPDDVLEQQLDDHMDDQMEQEHEQQEPTIQIREDIQQQLKVKVKISLIKALSKINNLSSSAGVIKIYMEPDLPLKMICSIGTYGKLTIYLQEATE